MKLKYVVFNEAFPVVFGEYFAHRDIKAMGEPTSAGFFSLKEVEARPEHDTCSVKWIEVHPYGESVSLGLKSKETDRFLLERLFNHE